MHRGVPLIRGLVAVHGIFAGAVRGEPHVIQIRKSHDLRLRSGFQLREISEGVLFRFEAALRALLAKEPAVGGGVANRLDAYPRLVRQLIDAALSVPAALRILAPGLFNAAQRAIHAAVGNFPAALFAFHLIFSFHSW